MASETSEDAEQSTAEHDHEDSAYVAETAAPYHSDAAKAMPEVKTAADEVSVKHAARRAAAKHVAAQRAKVEDTGDSGPYYAKKSTSEEDTKPAASKAAPKATASRVDDAKRKAAEKELTGLFSTPHKPHFKRAPKKKLSLNELESQGYELPAALSGAKKKLETRASIETSQEQQAHYPGEPTAQAPQDDDMSAYFRRHFGHNINTNTFMHNFAPVEELQD
jgi:hypothetical protein